MKKYIAILILSMFLIAGCEDVSDTKEPAVRECASDSDCMRGGCSGQICGSRERVENLITTCEWMEVYGCYRMTDCGCVDGKCDWQENKEFNDCMEKYA